MKVAKTVNKIEKLMKQNKDAFNKKIKTNEYKDILKVLTDSNSKSFLSCQDNEKYRKPNI